MEMGGVVSADVVISVESVNDLPQVVGEDINVLENQAVELFDWLKNEVDVDGDSLNIVAFLQGNKGSTVGSIEGNALHYTPKSNYYGSEIFTYSVSDVNGGVVESAVVVHV